MEGHNLKREMYNFRETDLLAPDDGSEDLLSLSGHQLPISRFGGHAITFGMTGTGKSLLMRSSIAFAAASLRSPEHCLIDFDVKGSDLPLLTYFAEKRGVPCYHLGVGDARSVALDIAGDSEGDPEYLWELTHVLIPDDPGANNHPFFKGAVRSILYACMLALTEQRELEWGLHDLYNLALSKADRLCEYVQSHPEAARMIDGLAVSGSAETVGNIKTSLLVELQRIRPLAAKQYHTPREQWLGLKDLLATGGSMVLTYDPKAHHSSVVLMQLVFSKLYREVLSLPDSTSRHIFCFMDEVAALGRINQFEEFLNIARSKGGMINMATQSLGSLKALYGEHGTSAIVSACDFHTFMRCDPETANFASELIGDRQYYQPTESFSLADGLVKTSISVEDTYRRMYLPHVFTNLPKAYPAEGIFFVMRSALPGVGQFVRGVGQFRVPPAEVEEFCKPPVAKDVPARVPRPIKQSSFPVGHEAVASFGAVSADVADTAKAVDGDMTLLYDILLVV